MVEQKSRNEYMREYRKKNREKLRKYQREWKKKNKVWLKPKRKEYQRLYQKKRGKERIKKVRKILGTKCVICGYQSNFVRYHEIHGNPHPSPSNNDYVLNHVEDFICVCQQCHKVVHHLAKIFDELDTFIKYVQIIIKSKNQQTFI